MDIKDFHLNPEMKCNEYMRLPLTVIPPEIIIQYNLLPLVHDGYVYMEIRKGMYGFPQAGILGNKKLTKHLAPYGYVPTKNTPGLWKPHTKPISFSLVVEYFGIKYTNTADANHLMAQPSKLSTNAPPIRLATSIAVSPCNMGLSHQNGGNLNARVHGCHTYKNSTSSPYRSPTCTARAEQTSVWANDTTSNS
jgi:hypothetical protein